MRWQWHQLDYMQIICTLHQTDNHSRTSPLRFYRADALPAAQPTVSKHNKENKSSSGDEIANVNFFYNIAHVEASAYAHWTSS